MAREANYVAEERVYARDRNGIRRLVARPGDIITESQARAYGLLDEEGKVRGTGRTPRPDDEGPARRVTTVGGQQTVPDEGDEDGDQEPAEYPVHRGGPNWMLSDGSKFQGSREAAEQAEAALHEPTEPEQPPTLEQLEEAFPDEVGVLLDGQAVEDADTDLDQLRASHPEEVDELVERYRTERSQPPDE